MDIEFRVYSNIKNSDANPVIRDRVKRLFSGVYYVIKLNELTRKLTQEIL